MHAGLPFLNQNNIWLVCLYRPICQNFLVPHDCDVIRQHHGLGGLVILPSQQHGVFPVLEEAPVDILCHIIVPVHDF
eukprot:538433-Ditylum_brightwellii.AAC.1